MKKFLIGLASLSPVALLAAAGDGATEYTGSVAETIAADASATLTNFLTGVGPVVATIVVAGLGVWGGIALVGIIKRGFSAGKGR